MGGVGEGWVLKEMDGFQEYDLEGIMKPVRFNSRPNHLSCIETREEPTNLEEGLPDA